MGDGGNVKRLVYIVWKGISCQIELLEKNYRMRSPRSTFIKQLGADFVSDRFGKFEFSACRTHQSAMAGEITLLAAIRIAHTSVRPGNQASEEPFSSSRAEAGTGLRPKTCTRRKCRIPIPNRTMRR
jgi:hypothetical protein